MARVKCFVLILAVLSVVVFFLYQFTLKKIRNPDFDFSSNETTYDKRDEEVSLMLEVKQQERYLKKDAKLKKTIKAEAFSEDEENVSVHRKQRLPNAIIIGSAKAGTRALLVILKIHPDVKVCPVEVHFFDREENYRLGLEWYRKRMPPSRESKITVEKSPAYLTTKVVPQRVYNMSSTVKLLVIVRDPTTRAISDYTQLSSKVAENVFPKFEGYVTGDRDHKVVNKNRGIVKSGVYIAHLREWMKFFPLSQIHFVSGEELVKNPVAEVKLVEKFLNLRPMITEANFYVNKTKGFPCFIGKIGSGGKRKNGCLNEAKGRKHVEVREDVKKLLQDYYRPYNQQLYKVVGRDFNWA